MSDPAYDPDIKLVRSQDLLDSIGVDTHLAYQDGSYADNAGNVRDVEYLGTVNVRDGLSDGKDFKGNPNGSAPLGNYIAMAQAGERFVIPIDGSNATTETVEAQLDLGRRLEHAVPGSVIGIEGANEINNFPASFNGVTGQKGAIALQQYLYNAAKTDPTFKAAGVFVDYFTGYGATGEGEGPDPSTTPGLADFDTQHSYAQAGLPPRYYEEPSTTLPNEPGRPGPHDYTESGGDYTSGQGSVSQEQQAADDLDLLLDARQTGATRTYLYELRDTAAYGTSYGLFDTNNQPKQAATAIHDLTALLKDDGATATTFTPQAVGVTLSGLPSAAYSMQAQHSDGVTDEIVWAEPGHASTPTPSTVTETFAAPQDVKVYDPLLGSAPVATYTDVTSIQVQVSDHPVVAELTPAGGASPVTTPPSGTPPATTPTTGSSTAGPAPSTPAPSASPQPAPDPTTGAAPPVTTTPTGTGTAPVVTAQPPADTGSSAPPVTLPGGGTPVTSPPPEPAPDTIPAGLTPAQEKRAWHFMDWLAGHMDPKLGGARSWIAQAFVDQLPHAEQQHAAGMERLFRALDPDDDVLTLPEMAHDMGVSLHAVRQDAMSIIATLPGHHHG